MATKWIRPYSGGPYGSNDGSSYDDAWYRARDVELAAGDTLYVSGTLDDGGSDGCAFTQLFRSPSVEGTESSPITISGAPPGQTAGKIIGHGLKIETGDWSDEGSGVWSITGVSGSASWLYSESESWPNDDRFIFDHGSVPTSGDAPAFHKDGSNKLWYAPLTGTPTATVWTSGGAFLDFFSSTNTDDGLFNPDWIRIEDLKLRNFANPIRTMHNEDWVIDSADIGWCPATGIDPRDGTERLTISNCEIHNCISGIYASVGAETNGVKESVNNSLIDTNHVHDLRTFNEASGDCHGIAFQNGSHNRITGNTVEDIQGTGITVYIHNPTAHSSRISVHNEIDNNTVRRIRNTGQGTGTPNSVAHGIEWTGANVGRTSNVEAFNLIHDNTVSDVTVESAGGDGYGIRLKTHKYSAIRCYGNTISDCTYGHYLYSQNVNGGAAGGEAGGELHNETVTDCTHNIGYQGAADVEYSMSAMTYSGIGDFEVLVTDATEAACTAAGGAWGHPSSSQCTLPTVTRYNIYISGVLGVANVIETWRGAIEPSGTGNQYKAWRGAVEPAYIPPIAGRGSQRNRRRRFIEVNGKFIEVFSDAEAQVMLEAATVTEPVDTPIPEKEYRVHITPEIERALEKFKKKSEVVQGTSLLGKKRGFL